MNRCKDYNENYILEVYFNYNSFLYYYFVFSNTLLYFVSFFTLTANMQRSCSVTCNPLVINEM